MKLLLSFFLMYNFTVNVWVSLLAPGSFTAAPPQSNEPAFMYSSRGRHSAAVHCGTEWRRETLGLLTQSCCRPPLVSQCVTQCVSKHHSNHTKLESWTSCQSKTDSDLFLAAVRSFGTFSSGETGHCSAWRRKIPLHHWWKTRVPLVSGVTRSVPSEHRFPRQQQFVPYDINCISFCHQQMAAFLDIQHRLLLRFSRGKKSVHASSGLNCNTSPPLDEWFHTCCVLGDWLELKLWHHHRAPVSVCRTV